MQNILQTQDERTKTKKNSQKKKMSRITRENTKRLILMQTSPKFRYSMMKDVCKKTTDIIKEEIMDGLFFSLNNRNDLMSENKKRRIVRRIVEKRQAQASHHIVGRTDNLFNASIANECISSCWSEINRLRTAN